jgi:hypothetical protein
MPAPGRSARRRTSRARALKHAPTRPDNSRVRLLLAPILCVCALVAAPPAAAVDFGVTEDEFKSSGHKLYPQLAEAGMRRNVISVTWDSEHPTALPPETTQIANLIASARAHGIKVSFAVYLKRAGSLTTPIAVAQYSNWLQHVARRFPGVREWTGPNEPNLPRFWQPQFNPDCTNASAAAYLRAQSATYDTLKAVDRRIVVLGGALSGRGNDSCRGKSNISTSPVKFLKALGDAYRASRRTAPLMDGFSYHPYPPSNLAAPARGYAWPNAGLADLDRLKQAIWDAFEGTPQRTVEDGLKLHVDEIGWQVDTDGRKGYAGVENVATTDEATQARWYAEVVRTARCDPSIATLNFFHFVDESDRTRLQTGLLRADFSRRAAFKAVRAAIGERVCRGRQVEWRHTESVVGARGDFGAVLGTGGRLDWGLLVSAREGARFTGGIFRIDSALLDGTLIERSLASGSPIPRVAAVSGSVRVAKAIPLLMPTGLPPGRYLIAVRLTAEMNPARTFFVASPALEVQ